MITKQRAITIAAGGGAVLAAAAMLNGTGGAVAVSSAPATAEVLQAFPELARSQTSADALPGWLASGDRAIPSVEPTSSRLLGQDTGAGARYWLVGDKLGQLCFVLVLSKAPDVASMQCLPADQALEQGLAIQASMPATAQSARAYAVPDGYVMKARGLKALGDRLLIGDASVNAPSVALPAEGSLSTTSSKAASSRQQAASTASSPDESFELPPMPSIDEVE